MGINTYNCLCICVSSHIGYKKVQKVDSKIELFDEYFIPDKIFRLFFLLLESVFFNF